MKVASKNILHVSLNTFPPLSEKHSTKEIWKSLCKYFKNYHILARSEKYKFESYKEGNITLHLVPKFNTASFGITAHYLYYLIRKHKINLILSQDPIVGGFSAVNASKLFKIPTMVEIHADVYFRFFVSKNPYHKFLNKLTLHALKNCTKVRILSEIYRPKLHEMGINDDKIVLIPNRVNLELFNHNISNDSSIRKNHGIGESNLLITTIGRYVYHKGYEYLIKAFPTVLQECPNCFLLIIGEGELEEKYKSLIDDNKLNERVKLIGWMPQDKLRQFLKCTDIYVQPSMSEGMPRTILEAMAMKLPVIASRVGGIPGIIQHKKNGILIEPGSIEEIAKSIIYLAKNKNDRERLAENAYLEIENKYEWNKVFKLHAETLLSMTYQ